MRLHYIQHADFEGLGAIEDWAKSRNHTINCTKVYAAEKLPPLKKFDLLISLGGPQSPLNYNESPYLECERDFIRTVIDANKYVIGFCLGAQLIAEACGARTEKSPHKEVGIFPITLTSAAKNDFILKNFPTEFNVVHWHNDMPGLPKDAKILAYSAGCPRQIIKLSDKVYAFQCHFEPRRGDVERMLEEDPGMLSASQYTQNAAHMLAADYKAMNRLMYQFFDAWLTKE